MSGKKGSRRPKEPIYRDSELITSEMEYAGVLELRAGLDPDCPLNELARDVFAEMLNAAPESSALRPVGLSAAPDEVCVLQPTEVLRVGESVVVRLKELHRIATVEEIKLL